MDQTSIQLTPEQLAELTENIKKSVLVEISKLPVAQTDRVYSNGWVAARSKLENLFREGYANGCGYWYQTMTGLYAAFRLAFRKEKIMDLRFVGDEKVMRFADDLIALIDKYRAEIDAEHNKNEVSENEKGTIVYGNQ